MGFKMADQIFENPKLAAIYDFFDGERNDLVHYLEIVNELGARSILDVGCGTGSFVSALSANGFDVIGLEPAKASLDIAQKKIKSENVRWVQGIASDLPSIKVDMAVMTGNVAQVFLTDQDWHKTLESIKRVLKPNGHLVFEVRDPSKKAWENWNKEETYRKVKVPDLGDIEEWCDLIEVSDGLIHFRWNYIFESNNELITSDSTLRFREKDEIINSLKENGFKIIDIRDAPDRPGKEFVFIVSVDEANDG